MIFSSFPLLQFQSYLALSTPSKSASTLELLFNTHLSFCNTPDSFVNQRQHFPFSHRLNVGTTNYFRTKSLVTSYIRSSIRLSPGYNNASLARKCVLLRYCCICRHSNHTRTLHKLQPASKVCVNTVTLHVK